MPPSLGRTFMSAFSKLAKYKIIWKWSGEPLSGLPSNVLQLKWVPQIPVLGKSPRIQEMAICIVCSTN